MEPAPTLSTVTIVTVLQASTEPTVQSVSTYRFEFHVFTDNDRCNCVTWLEGCDGEDIL